MRYILILLAVLVCGPLRSPAWAYDDLVLPSVEFSATAVQQTGKAQRKQTIRYKAGMLRIDQPNGFSTTILNLNTQTQYLLMVNRTYLVLPMDSELFRRFIARAAGATGARKMGTARIENLPTTKYAFGDDGALKAAGFYWLSGTGIMVRREYDDGVFGQNVHHKEFLEGINVSPQPADLFVIPPGYAPAK